MSAGVIGEGGGAFALPPAVPADGGCLPAGVEEGPGGGGGGAAEAAAEPGRESGGTPDGCCCGGALAEPTTWA